METGQTFDYQFILQNAAGDEIDRQNYSLHVQCERRVRASQESLEILDTGETTIFKGKVCPASFLIDAVIAGNGGVSNGTTSFRVNGVTQHQGAYEVAGYEKVTPKSKVGLTWDQERIVSGQKQTLDFRIGFSWEPGFSVGKTVKKTFFCEPTADGGNAQGKLGALLLHRAPSLTQMRKKTPAGALATLQGRAFGMLAPKGLITGQGEVRLSGAKPGDR